LPRVELVDAPPIAARSHVATTPQADQRLSFAVRQRWWRKLCGGTGFVEQLAARAHGETQAILADSASARLQPVAATCCAQPILVSDGQKILYGALTGFATFGWVYQPDLHPWEGFIQSIGNERQQRSFATFPWSDPVRTCSNSVDIPKPAL
jgi:hypothetical protein